MNVDANIQAGAAPASKSAKLLEQGFEELQPFLKKSKGLRQSLVRLGKIGDKATNRAARKLHHQLKHAEPSITMIGQVKAGKTSLVNAMVGQPDTGRYKADVVHSIRCMGDEGIKALLVVIG